MGRLEQAIASYDKAVEIKPDKDEAWNNRGIALGKLGRLEQAIVSYDKVLAIKPDNNEAWLNRASALIKLGRWKEGIASNTKAFEINPSYQKEILSQLINSLLKRTGLNKIYRIYTHFLKLIGFKR